ncbi:MAG: DUF3786 domain-containing protein [Pirellulales bacterium]
MTRPAPQEPDRIAKQKAVESLRSQSAAQLEWLGAQRAGSRWRLPVLDEVLPVQPDTGEVFRDDGQSIRSGWRILVLHYLDVRTRPRAQPTDATFASFPSARTYASVYENRVNGRLCATVGKDLDTLRTAANAIGARDVPGGDMAIEVNVFPRIPVRLIWYAGDEELPPACTLLLPANIDSFLCTEDIVVLSESFVSRLSGKPF